MIVYIMFHSEDTLNVHSFEKCRIFRRWVKTPVLLLAVGGAKFMKVWDGVEDHL